LRRRGVNLDAVARQAAAAFEVDPELLLQPGQLHAVVASRSLLCYWAVRELGETTTGLARRLALTQAAVSIAVRRGERIAKERGLQLIGD